MFKDPDIISVNPAVHLDELEGGKKPNRAFLWWPLKRPPPTPICLFRLQYVVFPQRYFVFLTQGLFQPYLPGISRLGEETVKPEIVLVWFVYLKLLFLSGQYHQRGQNSGVRWIGKQHTGNSIIALSHKLLGVNRTNGAMKGLPVVCLLFGLYGKNNLRRWNMFLP